MHPAQNPGPSTIPSLLETEVSLLNQHNFNSKTVPSPLRQMKSALGIPSVRGFPGQKDLAGKKLTEFPGHMNLADQIVTGWSSGFQKPPHIFGGQIHLAEWFGQKTHHDLEA